MPKINFKIKKKDEVSIAVVISKDVPENVFDFTIIAIFYNN